jgi:hypothetical protein
MDVNRMTIDDCSNCEVCGDDPEFVLRESYPDEERTKENGEPTFVFTDEIRYFCREHLPHNVVMSLDEYLFHQNAVRVADAEYSPFVG